MAQAGKYSSAGGTSADISQAPALPADVATWMVPGSTGALPGASPKQTQTTLQALARFFGIRARGPQLETEVIAALADHYGIKTNIETPGSMEPTTEHAAVGGSPGRAGGAPREASVTTVTSTGPTQEPNAKALAAIAQAAGADGADLGSIAAKIGIATPGAAPVKPAVGLTAGQEYANFVKALNNPAVQQWAPGGPKETFKAYMSAWLEQGNFLNASANGGSPDNASIAGAYATLLGQAKAANTTIQKAYDTSSTSANLPSGQAPTQTVSETAAFVQGMGEKLGIYLSPADITKISNMYEGDVTNAGGPSTVQDEIKNTVIQYFNPNDPRNPPGAANDMYQKVLASANAYGIPVASADIMKWVTNGIQNSAGDSYSIAQAATDTAAAAATHYQQLAEGLYPTLAPQIQAGQQVADLIAPYNTITSQYTGVDSATLTDPGSAPGGPTGKYYGFLQGARDPKTNAPTMQTMDQWRKTLMQDPQYGFTKTQGAQDMAEQMSAAILNEFGRVNTMGGTSTPFQSALPSSGFQGDLTANTSAA